jgi:hypothetical protein
VKAWFTHDRLERASALSYFAFAATVLASGWQAGWPAENVRAQGWAVAIGVPAFLLGTVFHAIAAFRDPDDEETNDKSTYSAKRG